MDDLLYRRIAKTLEDGILSGAYRDGDPVPSTNQFARLYAINPATAGKGLNLLVADGVLYKRRGLGMFVSPGAAEKVKSKRRAAFLDGYVRPMVREGRSLGLDRGELLAMVEQAIGEGASE